MHSLLSGFSVVLFAIAMATAGEPAPTAPTISVNASGKVQLLPKSLQVVLTLKGKGTDAAGAIASLKEHRSKFAAEFTKLGAKADSFKDELPTLYREDPRAAMRKKMMAMKRRGRLARKKPKEEEKKPEVIMQQVFRARIPFKGTDATSIIIESDALKTKLNEATKELLKAMEGKKEEAETEDDVDDDMDMVMERHMYNRGEDNSGPFRFAYYAPITDDLREKALQDALKKAKATALRGAKAVGKAEITLSYIGLSSGGGRDYGEVYGYDRWGRPRGGTPPEDGLVSSSPKMSLNSSVRLTYKLK